MNVARRFDITQSPLSGTVLIEASAGTGKTYAISGLYLRLVLEKALEVENILVVTFTVAATGELRERLRGRLRATLSMFEDPPGSACGEEMLDLRSRYADDPLQVFLVERFGSDSEARERLSRAIRNFDEASIFTIHSFCQRALLENAFESGALFQTELEAADDELLESIAEDYYRKNWYDAPLCFVEFSAAQGVSPASLASLARKRPLDPEYILDGGATGADADETLEAARSLEKEYGALCEAWNAARASAEAFLHGARTDGILKANIYSEAIIGRMIEKMDAYAGGGLIFGNTKDKKDKDVGKLSASSIRAAFKKGGSVDIPEFFARYEEFSGRRERAGGIFEGRLLRLKRGFLDYSSGELIRRKEQKAVRSFDDLIRGMHRALAAGGGSALARSVRRRYAAALIDEFQDTDPVQYSIFTTIFGADESLLYLIGDPKQAIYGFRGADIFAYMKAAASARTRATMDVNRRSAPVLVSAVNAMFSRVNDPFVFPEIGFTPVSAGAREPGGDPSPGMRIWFIPSSLASSADRAVSKELAGRTAVAAVASETVGLLSTGTYAPGDIAVLVRTGRQARDVQESLRAVGVPSVLYRTESVFASIEAVEMLHVLRAASNPGDARLLRAALATDIIGMTGDDIMRLSSGGREWESAIERFFDYRDTWARGGFMRMFHALLRGEGVHERILRRPDGERVLTNVLHLAELIHREQRKKGLGADGIVKWLRGAIAESDQPGEKEEHQLRLETDENAVTLITIHRSKGLEFPVVFCPFAWDVRDIDEPYVYHDPARGNRPVFRLGGEGDDDGDARTAVSREQLAENLRLLYVSVTRAKQRCYLVWGRVNKCFDSAPAYLFHNPGDLGAGDIAARLAVHVEGLDDRRMTDDLSSLAVSSEGGIVLSEIPREKAPDYRPPRVKPPALSCRSFNGSVEAGRRVTSFSALAGGAPYERDRDFEYVPPAVRDGSATRDIFAFPRGARAGSCIHAIFENIDFSLAGGAERVVRDALALYGFDDDWTGALADMTSSVLRTPLESPWGTGGLYALAPRDRLHELEFTLPLAPVTPDGLAGAFARAGGGGLVADFSGSIARLGFQPVRGFLRGFIDMVFVRDGRYYLLDWKSNHLGNSPSEYSAERMAAEMLRHHYILQYHLYAVALHRYLARRVRDYDYGRHFGGVYYLFVRGMDPADDSRPGVFFDMPPAALIESLGRYFDGEDRP